MWMGAIRDPDFIPPKKPYGFQAMLDDILQFAAETVVDNGRLSFWMPTSNEEDEDIPIPEHPYLERLAVSIQVFNKCKRPAGSKLSLGSTARVSTNAFFPLRVPTTHYLSADT